MIDLRDYQIAALDAVEQASARGVRRPLIALPTGTGKTIVFVELIRRRGGRALVLVHRDELIQQTLDKLARVGVLDAGVVKAERDEHGAQVVVASVQTLSRPARLQRLTPDFSTVVVDEAHHGVAETYRRVLGHVGALASDGPLTLGVTATPGRGDGVGLMAIFEEIVYERNILDMIRAGYLSELRAVQVQLKTDFRQLHTRAGDFIETEAEQLLLAANAPEHVVLSYLQQAYGRRTLVFTPTVRVAHAMAETFRTVGLAAEALDGGTPIPERRAILARLRAGETKIVPNCAVLTEGFDEPLVDCIVIARPTKSRTLYTQMIGRGTRRHPTKADCLILDVVGAACRNDLVTVASLFGLPERGTIERRGVVAARQEVEDFQAQQGRLEAHEIELWRQRAERLEGVPLHWVRVEADHFVLSLGNAGQLHLTGADASWQVTLDEARLPRRVLADGLTLEYAQGVAEDFARKTPNAVPIIDPNARWRQQGEPATENQLVYLRILNVPIPAGLTKGQASDLICAAKARQRRP